MFCGQCGTKNHEGNLFCEACSAKLLKPQSNVQSNEQQYRQSRQHQRNQKPKSNKKPLVIGVLSVFVICAIALSLLFRGEQPSQPDEPIITENPVVEQEQEQEQENEPEPESELQEQAMADIEEENTTDVQALIGDSESALEDLAVAIDALTASVEEEVFSQLVGSWGWHREGRLMNTFSAEDITFEADGSFTHNMEYRLTGSSPVVSYTESGYVIVALSIIEELDLDRLKSDLVLSLEDYNNYGSDMHHYAIDTIRGIIDALENPENNATNSVETISLITRARTPHHNTVITYIGDSYFLVDRFIGFLYKGDFSDPVFDRQ